MEYFGIIICWIILNLISERGFWLQRSNQRIFLDEFAKKNGIKQPQDWGTVTVSQMRSQNGGSLLDLYNNSVLRTLKEVYTGKQ